MGVESQQKDPLVRNSWVRCREGFTKSSFSGAAQPYRKALSSVDNHKNQTPLNATRLETSAGENEERVG
jgi:hypothetical protein